MTRVLTVVAADKRSKDLHAVGWLFSEFEAELLLAPVTSPVPPDMTISAGHTALRVRALTDIGPCVFDAKWAPRANVPEGGPDSGQALNAMTWGNESVEPGCLTIVEPDERIHGLCMLRIRFYLTRSQLDPGVRMPRPHTALG